MTFQAKYTPEQRVTAVELVEEIALATGKRRGAVAAAATRLGLHPSIVAYWVSVADQAGAGETSGDRRAGRSAYVAGWSAWSGADCAGGRWCRPIRSSVHRRSVARIVASAGPVSSPPSVERVIGGMILERLSVAGRPALNQMTIKSAAEQAPRLLNRIVVGSRPESMRVQWRLAPLPVASWRVPRSGETASRGTR